MFAVNDMTQRVLGEHWTLNIEHYGSTLKSVYIVTLPCIVFKSKNHAADVRKWKYNSSFLLKTEIISENFFLNESPRIVSFFRGLNHFFMLFDMETEDSINSLCCMFHSNHLDHLEYI